MTLRTWFHQKLAWLALCAIVFGALAPTLLTFFQLGPNANSATYWAEICSATRSNQQIAVSLADSMPFKATLKHTKHDCGYCSLQQHTPVIPSLPSFWAAPPIASNQLSISSNGTTLFKRLTLNAHPPRAPPAWSSFNT